MTMHTALRVATILSLAAALAGCRSQGSPKSSRGTHFTSAPVVVRDGGSLFVEFTASELTDVTVAIKDGRGRIVRHLAAGVLGANPPAPLAPGKLAQRLEWDGCDDTGRKLPAGKYRVEVALGLAPRYAGNFGWNPRSLGHVHGMASAPGGQLYVMSGVGRDSSDGRFQVFSSKGKYLRTMLPRPASLPLDRVKPLGEMTLDGGERFPTCLLPQYGSRINQAPVVAANGDLIFANGPKRDKHPEGKRFQSVSHGREWPRRLLRLAADGGAPAAGYLGPLLGPGFERSELHLTLGADGKTVYVSGGRHAVFRVKWGEKEKPEVFVGTPGKSGSGKTGLKDPRGIAFDAEGRLYVADRGNHRIACFDGEGKFFGELRIEWPRQVLVHPRSGVVYVASGYRRCRLSKFSPSTSSEQAGWPKYEKGADTDLRSAWPVLTLDASGTRPVLYAANVERRNAATGVSHKAVVRITDAGGSFRLAGEISDGSKMLQPQLLGVDRRRELVYGTTGVFGSCARWDGRSGRREEVPDLLHPKANGIRGMTASSDGKVVTHVMGEHSRMDASLRPLPFADSGTYIARLPREDCPRSYYDRGTCIAPDGSLYHVHERGGYTQPMRVTAVKADGSTKKDSIVVFESRSAAAVRVDRFGNIYVLDHLKPPGKPVPDAFGGKVKIGRHNRFVYNYGSVLKFGPGGGTVKQMSRRAPAKRQLASGQLQFTTAEGRGDFVSEGAQWAWYGVSMIQPALGRQGRCMCWHPRFDLDDFGRVFLPDQLRCRAVVLDANGNRITAFGRYGNVDDRAPGIPLADPRTVMVSDRAIYIGDMSNNRIVRAELRYRTAKSCSIMLAESAEKLSAAVEAVRQEVIGISPDLARAIDWFSLPRNQGEARAQVCRRAASGGHFEIPKAYLKSGSRAVRLAAVWSLYGVCKEQGKSLLRDALADRDQLVRLAAADALLADGDASGVAEVFKGARSADPDVFKLAETVVLKKLVVWDAAHAQAGLVEPRKCYVPRHKMTANDVKVLGEMLLDLTRKDTRPEVKRAQYWFLREKTIYLLALSKRPEAVEPLLTSLRLEKKNAWGRNRNRLIGAMGLYRVREAVPDLLSFLARGRGSFILRDQGDRAEVRAAIALERIADPKSVGPLIELLASRKKDVRELSRRTLSRIFEPKTPVDRCLVPKGKKLEAVRIDKLPEPAAFRDAWRAFWKTNARKYPFDPDRERLDCSEE